MNPIVLYDRLAEVSEDLYRAITLGEVPDRSSLEALWVRLDDLVEQIPGALHEMTRHDEGE